MGVHRDPRLSTSYRYLMEGRRGSVAKAGVKETTPKYMWGLVLFVRVWKKGGDNSVF